MIICIKRILDIEDIQCFLKLNRENISKDEITKIITEKVKELQDKTISENNEKLKEDINDLMQKSKGIIKTINNYKNDIQKLKSEIQTIKNAQKPNEINQAIKNKEEKFKNQNLEKTITNNNNCQKEIQKLKEELANNKKEYQSQIPKLKEEITNNKRDYEIQIQKLKGEIINNKKDYETQIQKLKEEMSNNKRDYETLMQKLEKFIKDGNIQKDNSKKKIKKEKEIEEFQKNPEKLKYEKIITDNHSYGGCLYNFDVFRGLKDNIEYIIYINNEIYNYNIEIMRIEDNVKIKSLKGHKNRITVIRYFIKDNKEEYILTCDLNRLLIIWDINNDYNKKYSIEVDYHGIIYDALLLFNIFKNNYIVVSSDQTPECTKLYAFKDNTPFFRDIQETKKNNTLFMIPWLYKNKYYIIECCTRKISINNMLVDEEAYYTLEENRNSHYYCGYIYEDIFLCVSDENNNFIRILDLEHKVIYKEIKYGEKEGTELIPWNKYIIIGYKEGFVVINKDENEIYKKIKTDKGKVCGIKKIKSKKYGESLLVADSQKNIILYSIKD